MPSILKRSTSPEAVPYQFPQAQSLGFSPSSPPLLDKQESPPHEGFDVVIGPDEDPQPPERIPDPTNPVEFAQIQAEAILADAHRQAARLLVQAKADMEAELDALREDARQNGYRIGYTEGISKAAAEGKQQREAQALALGEDIKHFLEKASYARDALLEETRDELKDLCIAIAEKIIRVSLKSSGDIVTRMIQTATEKMKRKEWVHIYVADCDSKGIAKAAPQLNETLTYLSDHVRLVPMADDESGTCIIETPDEIIDASASTQLSNIRDLLSNG